MAEISDIDVVVFDVLGTLVDEPSGLRAAIRGAAPASNDATVDNLLATWQQHVESEQQRIAQGQRAYVNTQVIDREAAQLVADCAGVRDPELVAGLATAGQRLPPWDDSVAGLERLALHFPLVGLPNASRRSGATQRTCGPPLARSLVGREGSRLQAVPGGLPAGHRCGRLSSRPRAPGRRARLGPPRSASDGHADRLRPAAGG